MTRKSVHRSPEGKTCKESARPAEGRATSCPLCRVELKPEARNDGKAHHCARCRGHLVPLDRLERIRRGAARPGDASTNGDGDADKANASGRMRCPLCRGVMREEDLPVPVLRVHIELCHECGVAWLGGDDLALAKLAHEASHSFMNARDLHKRVAALDANPARKQAFLDAFARLPSLPDPMTELFEETVKLLANLRGRPAR